MTVEASGCVSASALQTGSNRFPTVFRQTSRQRNSSRLKTNLRFELYQFSVQTCVTFISAHDLDCIMQNVVQGQTYNTAYSLVVYCIILALYNLAVNQPIDCINLNSLRYLARHELQRRAFCHRVCTAGHMEDMFVDMGLMTRLKSGRSHMTMFAAEWQSILGH